MDFNTQSLIGIAIAVIGGLGLAWPKLKQFLPSFKPAVSATDPPFEAVQQLRTYFVLTQNKEGEAAALLCGKELFSPVPVFPTHR